MRLEIFIPFYGPLDYLKEAVESVIAQSDPEWRLTICDDAYPSPEPEEWVRSLADKRIAYVRNKSNLGVTANFNKCLSRAKDGWLVLMGGDDRLLPNYVSRAKFLISHAGDAVMIQPGVQPINGNGAPTNSAPDIAKHFLSPRTGKPIVLDADAALKSLMLGNWLYFPSIIWNRQAVAAQGFNPEFSVVQDLELESKLLMSGGSLLVDFDKTFEYRRHKGSVSSQGGFDGTRYLEEARLFKTLAKELSARGNTSASKRARTHIVSRLAALFQLIRGTFLLGLADRKTLIQHIFLS